MTTPSAPKSPPTHPPVTLWVCARCNPDPARPFLGRQWWRQLKDQLAGQPEVTVRASACLGGCDCTGVERPTPNGGCCAALGGPGRFQYVLNRFKPATDTPKLLRLLALYRAAPRGRLRLGREPDRDVLIPHVATRLPPTP